MWKEHKNCEYFEQLAKPLHISLSLEASLSEIPKVEVYLKSNKHDVEVEAGTKKKIEA